MGTHGHQMQGPGVLVRPSDFADMSIPNGIRHIITCI